MRVQKRDVIRIFDKLDAEEVGLVAHEDFIGRLFPDSAGASARGAARDDRADSDVRVALRKRPDLLEELVKQLKAIESKSE